MFSHIFKSSLTHVSSNVRSFGSCKKSKGIKIAVLGAAGGIGQPLSLLLKESPIIKQLNLQDIQKHMPGVAMDVSHIETKSKVKAFVGMEGAEEAVCGVDIVVVPAGKPRKPGMTRDDLFGTNASILRDLAEVTAKNNPDALFLVVTNPVNSLLPIASEVYKKHCVYNPKKIFGVTTLDITRSNRFIAEMCNMDPQKVNCPVICGHSGITIIPVVSQCEPKIEICEEDHIKLNKRVQEAGTEVVKAKVGMGSATLSMAYAGARFIRSLIRGMNGECAIECTMVAAKLVPGVEYFASPIQLGRKGVEKNYGIPKLNKFEQKLLETAIPVLKKEIKRGVDFVKKSSKCS